MTKPIHAMIRVLDGQRSIAFYKAALGLDVEGTFPFDGFTLIYLRGQGSEFELELTVNHDRIEPYDLGNGYGHLAVVIDDLDVEHARLTAAGLAPQGIKEFADERLPARFFFIVDPDGYKIEVLQRAGRYR